MLFKKSAGHHQERQRHGHLRHHQAATQREPPACRLRGCRLHRGHEIAARRLQRGDQSERHTRQHRHARGEQHDAQIGVEIEDKRQVGWHPNRGQQARRHVAESKAKRACNERQEDRLGQQLANQLAPRRAERETHGDLLLPGAGARQKQVRDIRARDQQHERREGQEDQRDRRGGRPNLDFGSGAQLGEDVRVEILVCLRI